MKVISRVDFSRNGCDFIKGHSYEYYDENYYSYGKPNEWFFVYQNISNIKGKRFDVESFRKYFFDKKEILNKKLKKVKSA